MSNALCVITALVCFTLTASAQTTNEVSRVLDGAGGAVSNENFRGHISALQPGPVGFSSNGKFLNSAGFLHSDALAPSSTDNTDGDGLTDWQEITGSQSDPIAPSDPKLADTDGDGITDEEEIQSGTNPADPNSHLQIVMSDFVGDSVRVMWQARGGRTYNLWSAGTIPGLNTNPTLVVQRTASGGEGPWMTTYETHTIQSVGRRHFKIEAFPQLFFAPTEPF